MTITVNEVTKVITVPQADLVLQSGITYTYDTDAFRLELKNWEASEVGGWRQRTHLHNLPVTVGGTTLARTLEIINGYTVTFEDGQYRVILQGSNNNIVDVANVNQVSIVPTNSAGLIDNSTPEQIADAVWQRTIASSGMSASHWLQIIGACADMGKLNGAGTNTVTIRDHGDTIDIVIAQVDPLTGDRNQINITVPSES